MSEIDHASIEETSSSSTYNANAVIEHFDNFGIHENDDEKWNELLRMELEACADDGCLNMGTHLIAVVKKR